MVILMHKILNQFKQNRQFNMTLAQTNHYDWTWLPLGLTTIVLLYNFIFDQLAQAAFKTTSLRGFTLNVAIDCLLCLSIIYYVHKLNLEPADKTLSSRSRGKIIFSGLLVMIVASTLIMLVETALIGHGVKTSANQQLLDADFKNSIYGSTYIALSSLVFAPVIEEFTFRYLIIKPHPLHFWCNRAVRSMISIVIFASLHVIGSANWYLVLGPYLVISIVLTWTYYRYHSFWTNVSLHASWNFLNLLLIAL